MAFPSALFSQLLCTAAVHMLFLLLEHWPCPFAINFYSYFRCLTLKHCASAKPSLIPLTGQNLLLIVSSSVIRAFLPVWYSSDTIPHVYIRSSDTVSLSTQAVRCMTQCLDIYCTSGCLSYCPVADKYILKNAGLAQLSVNL